MTIKERDTSIASFANMEPSKLAERAMGKSVHRSQHHRYMYERLDEACFIHAMSCSAHVRNRNMCDWLTIFFAEIAKQLQQTRSEEISEGGASWAETSRENEPRYQSFGSEARPLYGSEVRSPAGGNSPFGAAGRPTPSSMGGDKA
jgi:hypothetical protein